MLSKFVDRCFFSLFLAFQTKTFRRLHMLRWGKKIFGNISPPSGAQERTNEEALCLCLHGWTQSLRPFTQRNSKSTWIGNLTFSKVYAKYFLLAKNFARFQINARVNIESHLIRPCKAHQKAQLDTYNSLWPAQVHSPGNPKSAALLESTVHIKTYFIRFGQLSQLSNL